MSLVWLPCSETFGDISTFSLLAALILIKTRLFLVPPLSATALFSSLPIKFKQFRVLIRASVGSSCTALPHFLRIPVLVANRAYKCPFFGQARQNFTRKFVHVFVDHLWTWPQNACSPFRGTWKESTRQSRRRVRKRAVYCEMCVLWFHGLQNTSNAFDNRKRRSNSPFCNRELESSSCTVRVPGLVGPWPLVFIEQKKFFIGTHAWLMLSWCPHVAVNMSKILITEHRERSSNRQRGRC